jgi:hypothetical protein
MRFSHYLSNFYPLSTVCQQMKEIYLEFFTIYIELKFLFYLFKYQFIKITKLLYFIGSHNFIFDTLLLKWDSYL